MDEVVVTTVLSHVQTMIFKNKKKKVSSIDLDRTQAKTLCDA